MDLVTHIPPQTKPPIISPLASRVTLLPRLTTSPTKSHPRTAPSPKAFESNACTVDHGSDHQVRYWKCCLWSNEPTISWILGNMRHFDQHLIWARSRRGNTLLEQMRFPVDRVDDESYVHVHILRRHVDIKQNTPCQCRLGRCDAGDIDVELAIT